ncbi:hypothetical protein Rhein_3237 [Rheinheimera sp. A13L]|uniref:hypothetical protein n=1 Tax=Rheinheimera sp. A13L TaxID=506534 RepID=UPI00021256FC|nr:hypothetical protein [Rheinheimera sp. A13L]EGM76679.1 hypothetical protein Rhein_3237 [Rheinheimera sp. A13L]
MIRIPLMVCFVMFGVSVSASEERGFWLIGAGENNSIFVSKAVTWPWSPKIVSINPELSESSNCHGLDMVKSKLTTPFSYDVSNQNAFKIWIVKGVDLVCLRNIFSVQVTYNAHTESDIESNISISRPPPTSGDLQKAGIPLGSMRAELRFLFSDAEPVNFAWLRERPRISILNGVKLVSGIYPDDGSLDVDVLCYDSNGKRLSPIQSEYVLTEGIKFISLQYAGNVSIKSCDFLKKK